MEQLTADMSLQDKVDYLMNKSLHTEEEVRIIHQEADQFFLITMSIVIFFMQCGFAFLEAGSVRYIYLPKC